MKDNSTLFLIVGILAVHFLAGVGYLLYKILDQNVLRIRIRIKNKTLTCTKSGF